MEIDDNNEKVEKPAVKQKPAMSTQKKLRLWGGVVLGVIILVIAVQNRHPLPVELLFWRSQVPGIILLPFVFLLGMAAGFFVRKKPVRSRA